MQDWRRAMQVRPFRAEDTEQWDALCGESSLATFLHTRRFLSYHGQRFQDCSAVVEDGGRLVGVFPAAPDPQGERCVVSHPGASYGGLVYAEGTGVGKILGMFEKLKAFYREAGFRRLRYKAIPHIYQVRPGQEDLYALFRLDAVRYRCDLSCAVDLARPGKLHAQRWRSLKRARAAQVEIEWGNDHLAALWPVLEGNLARKHGVQPTHSLAEMNLLTSLFPSQISSVVARVAGNVEAGAVIFHSPNVWHAQYICSSPAGHDQCALDAVFDAAMTRAAPHARYFSFGISTEQGGRVLNEGLYSFKQGFGGGGVVHEFYELPL